jgi:hypothetical protein
MLKYFKENILKPTNEMCEQAGLESVPDEPYEEQRDDESDEPEVDHYEETMQNIELNNQSLTS